MAAAVVDRAGAILGVYTRPAAAERTPDIAVTRRAGRRDVRQRSGAALVADGPLHQRHPLPARRARTPPTPRSTASRTSTAAAASTTPATRSSTRRSRGRSRSPARSAPAPACRRCPASRPTRAAARAADRCSTLDGQRAVIGRHHDRQGRRARHRPDGPTTCRSIRAAFRSIAAARSSAASASPACRRSSPSTRRRSPRARRGTRPRFLRAARHRPARCSSTACGCRSSAPARASRASARR